MVDEKHTLIGSYWRIIFILLSADIYKYMLNSATSVAWIGEEGTLIHFKDISLCLSFSDLIYASKVDLFIVQSKEFCFAS